MQYNRHSIRLKNYNYKNSGMYFVTMCVQNDLCLFGVIKKNRVIPNTYGKIVIRSWLCIERQYPYVQLDQWVLMPDHFHAILIINTNISSRISRGGSRTAPTVNQYNQKPLGRIIGAFKTHSTKQINKIWNTPGMRIWQRNYYERIIRNQKEYYAIRQYIINNPKNWNQI